MSKATFMVTPDPENDLGERTFLIEVLPHPGGLRTGQGMQFRDDATLIRFLHVLGADSHTEAAWADALQRKQSFGIVSSYEEWRRLEEWAIENL